MKNKMKSLAMWLVIGVLGTLAIGSIAWASSGFSWSEVMGMVADRLAGQVPVEENLGASGSRFPNGLSADSTSPVDGEVRGTTLTITDGANFQEDVVSGTTTTTLTVDDSGTTYFISGANQMTYTLPATTTAAGVFYKFVISGAISASTTVVTAGSINDISGTLIVAGAVVDCDDEDKIEFWANGENVGDFFEIRSNGTKWFLGASGALTSAKLTCSTD